jgi:uncharacterized membrane protein
MTEDNEKKLREIILTVNELSELQQKLQRELGDAHRAIEVLRKEALKNEIIRTPVAKEEAQPAQVKTTVIVQRQEAPQPPVKELTHATVEKTPIEEFIGANLLNKIGIAVLVLGVGYGVKYSIDHELINPLTRIILGYAAGGILVALAFRLKPNYATFSAVLLSGGMASLYFVTYAAFDFYALIPQTLAFAMMVAFTVFTVFAALQYNMQVIAMIGLVGAYGVPFLLSDGSGKVVVLYSYMSIINAGILFLSFRKNWKELYYLAFALTWTIFGLWWLSSYNQTIHLVISLTFTTIFFATFYAAIISYRFLARASFSQVDVVVMLANAFAYFGFGYYSISYHPGGGQYLGLFAVINAVLHFIASLIIFRANQQDKEGPNRDVFYFAAGLVIVFITVAIPIQLDGSWVTLIWAAEATVLFFVGRTRAVPVYERTSYALVLLAFVSLLQDWEEFYRFAEFSSGVPHRFLLNSHFLTSLLVSASFASVLWMHLKNRNAAPEGPDSTRSMAVSGVLASLLLLTTYLMFHKEIQSLFEQRYLESAVIKSVDGGESYSTYDEDIRKFEALWLINYSAFFGLILSAITWQWIKNRTLAFVSVGLNTLVLIAFLVNGLISLAQLRYSFLNGPESNIYLRDFFHIAIRYISLLFVIPLLAANSRLLLKDYFNHELRQMGKTFLHIFLITLLSSELIHWLDMMRIVNSDKLALSILWSLYAMGLIGWGLRNKDRLVRILGMVLFGITLIKLFVYDISDLSTIGKTVVMITLGALLLVSSFLYNRVKKSVDEV